MSHVDEGLLHAYIDGAFEAGTPERADIEAHLAACADCRVRLDDARRIRDTARTALDAASPVSVEQPAWETVLAERARRSGTGGGAAPVRPTGRPRIPLAWAASIVLALGAGWMARAMLAEPGGGLPMEAARTLSPESEEAASLDELSAGRGVTDTDRREAASPLAAPAPEMPAATEPAAPPASQVAGARQPEQGFRDDRNERRTESLERQRLGDIAVREDMAKAAEAQVAPFAARAAGMANVVAETPLEIAADSASDRWVGTTSEAIAAAFERIPVTVEGQTPDTLQLAAVAGRPLARAIYILPAGVVEVLQWPVAEDGDAADTAEAEATPERPGPRRLRGVEVLVRGSSEDAVRSVRGWLR